MKNSETWQAKVRAKDIPERQLEDSSQVSFGPFLALTKKLAAAITEVTNLLTAGKGLFTSECVTIEMSGPDLPNLTIVDLPGIVRTVTDG